MGGGVSISANGVNYRRQLPVSMNGVGDDERQRKVGSVLRGFDAGANTLVIEEICLIRGAQRA